MDFRNIQQLLSQPTSLQVFDQIHHLVQQTSETTKKDLAAEGIYASSVGLSVTSPVHGFILYILCLGHPDVSIELLREHWNKIEYAVLGNWTMNLQRLGRRDDSFDPAIRDIALRTHNDFVERTTRR